MYHVDKPGMRLVLAVLQVTDSLNSLCSHNRQLQKVGVLPLYPFVCHQLTVSPCLGSSSCPNLFGYTMLALLALVLVFVFLLFAFAWLVDFFVSMALVTQLLHASSDSVNVMKM